MEEVEITEATDSDMEEVLDMMEAFNQIDNYPFDREVRKRLFKEFTSNTDLGKLLLITHEGQKVGYLVLCYGYSFEYGGRDAFIDEFYIRDSFQNKGIGKKALHLVDEVAQKNGVCTIHLEVEEHNQSAHQLYLHQGFKANQRYLLTKKIIR